MCHQAEETMSHLLDIFPFAATIWDKRAMMFKRSDRIRGQPPQTIRDWYSQAFKNPIIRAIWEAFLGMAMWCVWKERNARIF